MHQVQEGQLTDEKLKPGELTQEQLALLNNLMYIKDSSEMPETRMPQTLEEYLDKYRDNNYEKVTNLPEGVIGFVYNVLVKPIIIDGYDNYVEPVLESGADKANDIGDWWDALWW